MGTKRKQRQSGPLDNARHEAFAQAIALQGLTPHAAYQAAYQSAGLAKSRGNPYALREDQRIINRINELRGRVLKKMERNFDVTVERLTETFAHIGFSNVTDVLAVSDGQVLVRDTSEMSEATRAAISEIRQTKDGIVVKMHNKTDALAQLAKHVGYYKENVQLNVTLSLADLVNMSYRPDLPELPAPDVIEHEEKSE